MRTEVGHDYGYFLDIREGLNRMVAPPWLAQSQAILIYHKKDSYHGSMCLQLYVLVRTRHYTRHVHLTLWLHWNNYASTRTDEYGQVTVEPSKRFY